VAIQITISLRKVVSSNWPAQCCIAGHALAGIAIATMMSLRHRAMTDSHDRPALAEVCTVPVTLVTTTIKLLKISFNYNHNYICLIMAALCNRAGHYIFALWFLLSFFLSFFLSIYLFSLPNLIRHRLDVCHTCTHGVALVRI